MVRGLQGDALVREATLIAAAWDALRAGDLVLARRKTAAHAQAFERGHMRLERKAIEVVIGCRMGRVGAQRAARDHLARYADAPYVDVVRSECSG